MKPIPPVFEMRLSSVPAKASRLSLSSFSSAPSSSSVRSKPLQASRAFLISASRKAVSVAARPITCSTSCCDILTRSFLHLGGVVAVHHWPLFVKKYFAPVLDTRSRQFGFDSRSDWLHRLPMCALFRTDPGSPRAARYYLRTARRMARHAPPPPGRAIAARYRHRACCRSLQPMLQPHLHKRSNLR